MKVGDTCYFAFIHGEHMGMERYVEVREAQILGIGSRMVRVGPPVMHVDWQPRLNPDEIDLTRWEALERLRQDLRREQADIEGKLADTKGRLVLVAAALAKEAPRGAEAALDLPPGKEP